MAGRADPTPVFSFGLALGSALRAQASQATVGSVCFPGWRETEQNACLQAAVACQYIQYRQDAFHQESQPSKLPSHRAQSREAQGRTESCSCGQASIPAAHYRHLFDAW